MTLSGYASFLCNGKTVSLMLQCLEGPTVENDVRGSEKEDERYCAD